MPLSNTLISPPSVYSQFLPRDCLATNLDAANDSGYVEFAVNRNPRFPTMEPLSREELERFQKLSNEYEPELQVG